jgi:hypothetical protein
MNALGQDETVAAAGDLGKRANHEGEHSIEKIAAEGCPTAKPLVLFSAGHSRQGQRAGEDELSALPS